MISHPRCLNGNLEPFNPLQKPSTFSLFNPEWFTLLASLGLSFSTLRIVLKLSFSINGCAFAPEHKTIAPEKLSID